MAKVAPKVAKATMYKMISYKGVTGVQSKYTPITAAARLPKVENSVNTGLRSLVSGLNALGATLNTIAANTQANLEGWRDNIRGQVKGANALQKQEEKTDKKDRKRKLFKDKQTEKRRKFQLRSTKEEKSEKKKNKKKMGFAERGIGAAKKVGGGLFGILGNLIASINRPNKFPKIPNKPPPTFFAAPMPLSAKPIFFLFFFFSDFSSLVLLNWNFLLFSVCLSLNNFLFLSFLPALDEKKLPFFPPNFLSLYSLNF
jgi:hypothetical protein